MELLDTRRMVETPEGVELALDVAGPLSRAFAFSIDLLLRTVIYTVLATVIIAAFDASDAGVGVMLLLTFLLEWAYPVVFEAGAGGATPGKMALGLVVLHDDGTPVGWTAAVVRNLLRAADFLPFGFLFGLTSMAVQPQFKRLGDLAAGTVVVYRRRTPPPARLPEVPAMPLPVRLTADEQRALVDYAARSPGWTDDRVAELADVLVPVVGGPGPVAAKRLQGMARWLLGVR